MRSFEGALPMSDMPSGRTSVAILAVQASTHVAWLQAELVPEAVRKALTGILELLPRDYLSRRRVDDCRFVVGDICQAGH